MPFCAETSLANDVQAILSKVVSRVRVDGFQAGIQLTEDTVLTISAVGFQYGTGGFLST
jgi:hypothetical protein